MASTTSGDSSSQTGTEQGEADCTLVVESSIQIDDPTNTLSLQPEISIAPLFVFVGADEDPLLYALKWKESLKSPQMTVGFLSATHHRDIPDKSGVYFEASGRCSVYDERCTVPY